MTPKVSERTYKTETAFRKEVQRRLEAPLPDRLWAQKGGSRWHDAKSERGYALVDDVNFVITQYRHLRRSGVVPKTEVAKEPRDRKMWLLRSRFTAWCLEDRARDLRRRLVPKTLPTAERAEDWLAPESGVVEELRVEQWMHLLAGRKGSAVLGKPVVRGGPDIELAEVVAVHFSFPETNEPRFLDKRGRPEVWWSATPRNDERIDLSGYQQGGPALRLHVTYEANRLLEGLVKEWNGIKMGTAWSLAQMTGFYLFGAVPLLQPLKARVASGVDWVGIGRVITMDIDPRIPPQEVADFYASLARSERATKTLRPRRPLSPGVIEVVEFVLARTLPGNRPSWPTLWSEWQQSHREYSTSTFARTFTRAVKKLEREAWDLL